ncbi:MAG: transketolase [Chloroflexota bacterium]|nr:transketolase [Chloroflexota bacterium]
MKSESMRDRFVRVVTELLDTDPRVAVVMADITVDRFRASGACERHPLRVINVGIREQLMVNVAAGMALGGTRAIAHSFAPFLIERAFEQVKLAFSHQGIGGILVSCGASYDVAAYGRTHEAPEDVALMATLPGWRIHVPGHPDEADAFLRDAARTDDAVYIRLSERKNASPVASDGGLVAQRRGSRGTPTVIAVGPMLDPVMEATAALDATVLYTATVQPFDRDGLRAAVTGTDVVLVEPYLEGTSGAELSAALSDKAHRLLCIGVPRTEHRKYGSPQRHDEAHGLDAAGLRRRITHWLGGTGRSPARLPAVASQR